VDGSVGSGGNLICGPSQYQSHQHHHDPQHQPQKQWETELDLILPAGETPSWSIHRQPMMMSSISSNQPQVNVSRLKIGLICFISIQEGSKEWKEYNWYGVDKSKKRVISLSMRASRQV
jgi:hypothetical protein